MDHNMMARFLSQHDIILMLSWRLRLHRCFWAAQSSSVSFAMKQCHLWK